MEKLKPKDAADSNTKQPSSQAGIVCQKNSAAGAIWDYSRGAYADLMHRQAEASEYVPVVLPRFRYAS